MEKLVRWNFAINMTWFFCYTLECPFYLILIFILLFCCSFLFVFSIQWFRTRNPKRIANIILVPYMYVCTTRPPNWALPLSPPLPTAYSGTHFNITNRTSSRGLRVSWLLWCSAVPVWFHVRIVKRKNIIYIIK